ncbi:hypothetical protein PC128_g1933 [Phytophthora cactorum]|nr:hypothetical protein PC128_g1933 [Phytophthora cactorum]
MKRTEMAMFTRSGSRMTSVNEKTGRTKWANVEETVATARRVKEVVRINHGFEYLNYRQQHTVIALEAPSSNVQHPATRGIHRAGSATSLPI